MALPQEYPEACEVKYGKQQGGGLAVKVRPDGTAVGNWPRSQLAVSVDTEGSGYRIYGAYKDSGNIAVSFDAQGNGFVNNPRGKVPLFVKAYHAHPADDHTNHVPPPALCVTRIGFRPDHLPDRSCSHTMVSSEDTRTTLRQERGGSDGAVREAKEHPPPSARTSRSSLMSILALSMTTAATAPRSSGVAGRSGTGLSRGLETSRSPTKTRRIVSFLSQRKAGCRRRPSRRASQAYARRWLTSLSARRSSCDGNPYRSVRGAYAQHMQDASVRAAARARFTLPGGPRPIQTQRQKQNKNDKTRLRVTTSVYLAYSRVRSTTSPGDGADTTCGDSSLSQM